MNWVNINDGLMLNLEGLRAISMEDEFSTRIFTSASDSSVVQVPYETLRTIIFQRRSLESAAQDSFTRDIRSLVKGQRTPVP